MRKLSETLRKKLPRIILNGAVIFSLWFIATLISPAVQSIGAVIPGSNVSAGFLIIVSLLVVIGYFAVSIAADSVSIAEASAELLMVSTRIAKPEEQASFRKAAKEIVLALVLILLTPIVPGMFVLIPVVGQTLATLALFLFIGFSFSLLWSAGKFLYSILSRYTGKIAEVVAGEAEKIEEKNAAREKKRGKGKGQAGKKRGK